MINLDFETYEDIINYYKNNKLDSSMYTEKHHIIPVSEGGKDSELIDLPYPVHAYAHFLRARELLLAKKYKEAYSNINASRMIISSQQITFDSDLSTVRNLILSVYKDYSYYVTNGDVSFRVYKDNLETFLKENPEFRLGRVFKTPKGRSWVNNGEIQTYIDNDVLDEFLMENPNYKKGMLPFKGKKKFKESYKGSTFGKKWINKNGIRKNVEPSEIDSYLKEGWSLGSGNHSKRYHSPDKKFVTGYKWMHNDTLRESKQVNPIRIEEMEKAGWVIGRVMYPKYE